MEDKRKPVSGRNGGTLLAGGKPGNNGGRPPKLPSLDYIGAKILSEGKGADEGEEGDTNTRLAKIVEQLAKKAENGDIEAIKVLLNRYYGMPSQKMDVTTGGESINTPPTLNITFQDREEDTE